jgi:hypothetical protein
LALTYFRVSLNSGVGMLGLPITIRVVHTAVVLLRVRRLSVVSDRQVLQPLSPDYSVT